MPSSKAKLGDIIAQLGLRGPYSQRAEDYKLCPAVEELYKVAITDLCKKHYKKFMRDIKGSSEIMDASAQLLKEYGPIIWCDDSDLPDGRPWLFAPLEGATGALYDDDRYYFDPHDFKLYVQL